MTSLFRGRGRMALVLTLFGLVVTAAVMTAVFARPTPVPAGVLGAEWECAQLFWVTSCTRVAPVTPASRQHPVPHGAAADLRAA
ncbi:conserved exported hypothetical protein [Bradyrhizobium sp. ORS 375]|uniref:hypothetical protein n=1 Tax=Bradyrhizobium sp. (strain ORS 375) TaxID=566679 RepID=UPI000240759B|nr:hypothetical protein [Bradyrhizobium sp. ORS 375]CCD96391.1 conserved exported hypothetical protein [Bradyrhizobium sp. ORS 375]